MIFTSVGFVQEKNQGGLEDENSVGPVFLVNGFNPKLYH